MKYLLDTHVFLWWLDEPRQLADRARIAIANPKNHVFVSAVCFIEMAIKQSRGKLTIEADPEAALAKCRFQELPLSIAHAAALRSLPMIHNDPFDRMLVAQARHEGLTLITRDGLLADYKIPVLAA